MIDLVAQQHDARLGSREMVEARDQHGIRARVVDDHEAEVARAVAQHAREAALHVLARVVHRHDDVDAARGTAVRRREERREPVERVAHGAACVVEEAHARSPAGSRQEKSDTSTRVVGR